MTFLWLFTIIITEFLFGGGETHVECNDGYKMYFFPQILSIILLLDIAMQKEMPHWTWLQDFCQFNHLWWLQTMIFLLLLLLLLFFLFFFIFFYFYFLLFSFSHSWSSVSATSCRCYRRTEVWCHGQESVSYDNSKRYEGGVFSFDKFGLIWKCMLSRKLNWIDIFENVKEVVVSCLIEGNVLDTLTEV